MASRKPVIHGRDHLPGGSDPIPGLKAVTAYDPRSSEEHLFITQGTPVAAGATTTLSWIYYDGGTFVDLSTTDKPGFTTAGVYSIHVGLRADSTDSGHSATPVFPILLEMGLAVAQGTLGWPPGTANTLGRTSGIYVDPTDGGTVSMELDQVAVMDASPASDWFQASFTNSDTITWDITAVCSVVRIIQL